MDRNEVNEFSERIVKAVTVEDFKELVKEYEQIVFAEFPEKGAVNG